MSSTQKRSFFYDIFIRGGSDFLAKGFQIAILPILAKNLGSSMYGIYSQVLATIAFIVPFISLRLGTALTRYFPGYGDNRAEQKSVFSSALLLISGNALFLGTGIYFARTIVSKLVFNTPSLTGMVILMIVLLWARVSYTMVISFYRAIKSLRIISYLQVIRYLLYFIFIYIAIAVKNMPVGIAIIVYAAVDIILSVGLLIYLSCSYLKDMRASINFGWAKKYLKYSLPLVPYTTFVGINYVGDRFLITHIKGIEFTGIYAISYAIAAIPIFFYSAIAFVIYPYISSSWTNGDMDRVRYYLEKSSFMFLWQAIPAMCGLIALSPLIIEFFAGRSFVCDRLLITYISAGQIFLGLFQIYGLILDLRQKTYYFTVILAITACLNIILNLIMIPVGGIQGAAVATLLTYISQFIAMALIGKRYMPFRLDFGVSFIFRCLAASLIMTGVIMIFYPADLLGLAGVIIAGMVVYILSMAALTYRHPKYDMWQFIQLIFSGAK